MVYFASSVDIRFSIFSSMDSEVLFFFLVLRMSSCNWPSMCVVMNCLKFRDSSFELLLNLYIKVTANIFNFIFERHVGVCTEVCLPKIVDVQQNFYSKDENFVNRTRSTDLFHMYVKQGFGGPFYKMKSGGFRYAYNIGRLH